ncbi:copper resistance protein CopC [Actinoplanes sp. NPDC049265]|uniref:copper resistance CopC family protein n=1 Tax=Actinoplanes sp. NPDC049265 TaxID=3363902 RepID=UPI003717B767
MTVERTDRRAVAGVGRVMLGLAVAGAVLLPGTPALAHNALVSSTPAGDATLTVAPASVSLVFTERLNPDFTTVAVSDAARARVATGTPVIDGATGVVPVTQPLANGSYTVAYRVVSVDGHSVQGSYRFTLADPALPPAAAPAVSGPAAAAPPASSSGLPVPVLIGLVAAALLLIAVAAVVYRRGRRRAGAEA